MLENLILAQTIELISDPVIASDELGRVVFTNHAHAKLTGWEQEEIKGRNYKLLYDIPEAQNLAVEPIAHEGTLYLKDSSKMPLKAISCPLTHPQDPSLQLGKLAIFYSTPDTAGIARSSDDFVSTVSHELRTPLTSIRGFAETMLQSGDRLNEESKKRFLQIIKDQADHVSRLVEDLLFVSRLDNHKIHLVVRPLDLKKHVDKVCEAMTNQAGGRIFLYEFANPLPGVLADSDRLEQILTNLISNAIKYSPDSSLIKVRAHEHQEDPAKLKISVIDNGVGVPEEDQATIFNRFSRVDNPLTRKIKGTGLGLYITKSLLIAMNGEVWLEKSTASETIFSFTLPIALD
ncbi:MAG: ATP-binding protein [Candidatus Caenarcaniphilales bacterium]|nr:ATP-binding protein [Candidatus Caenarcaniphilales bacterium]